MTEPLKDTIVGVRAFRCPACFMKEVRRVTRYSGGYLTPAHMRMDLPASLNASYSWRPGWNVAQCLNGVNVNPMAVYYDYPRHDAPAPQCHCGLYALHPENPLTLNTWANPASRDLLRSIVELQGRAEVHYDGLRAQRARIVASETCRGCGFRPADVPVVKDVCAVWREFGNPYPVEERPRRDTYMPYGPIPFPRKVSVTGASNFNPLMYVHPVTPPRRSLWLRLSSLFAGWR